MIVYLRLAFGTACVLAPGWAVARAFGQRATSAMLAWALACVFVAWTAVFVLHRSIHLAVAVLAVLFVTALVVGVTYGSEEAQTKLRRSSDVRTWLKGPIWVAGTVLGWALWHVQSAVVGDGLFHEARVRKLVDLTSLHLRSVDEFKDGGLHPGYAFPLWHGFLALVSWFSGVDPGAVVRHEPSLLAPLACVVAFEAGVALFGTRGAGVSVLLAQLAVFCFGPGHGGSYATLALPGTAARQLLVPAALALFFTSRPAATFAIFGALTLTHPTYALFLLIPLAGYAIVRYADWREWWRVAVAALVPTGLVLLWLKPIVDETISHNPKPGEVLRGLRHYGDQLVVANDHHYRLAAEVFGRSGAVAVAALVLLPVCAFAVRRKWGAFVVGGTLLILVLVEVPWLFVHFSDAVSLSQSRRVAGFAPLPFALAGAFVLLARSLLALPVALAAGIVLQRLWPGDFDYGLRHGGPALATWIALFGGAAALAYALVRRPREPRERHGLGAAAMLCFVAPVVVHGIWNWSPRTPSDPLALSPRLVHRLRTVVPKGSVVIAPLQASYRVTADAPLYVVALPVSHVANTKANDPYGRRKAIVHWNLTNDPKVAKRYGATWAIRSGRLYPLKP